MDVMNVIDVTNITNVTSLKKFTIQPRIEYLLISNSKIRVHTINEHPSESPKFPFREVFIYIAIEVIIRNQKNA